MRAEKGSGRLGEEEAGVGQRRLLTAVIQSDEGVSSRYRHGPRIRGAAYLWLNPFAFCNFFCPSILFHGWRRAIRINK